MFALVDCNNFYVSCERLFRPDLQNKPVVVLSNNDGCIVSRSNEAKALGIKMAEPYFKRADFFKANQVTAFSSNYALYADLSDRVMSSLQQFSPHTEIYSIDECFLDVSGILVPLTSYAHTIRSTVSRNTGIPVGVGLAQTKTLAKIASKIAKKYKRLNGVCVIESEQQRLWSLQNTPIEDVWGVGRKYAKKLQESNILTAYDLTQASDQWVRSKMSVLGLRTKRELLGESCLPLELIQQPKQSICVSRSFGQKTNDKAKIIESLANYASSAAEKLRRQNSLASIVTVFAHTDPFNKNLPLYSASLSQALPHPSNFTADLVRLTEILFTQMHQPGQLFKKAGIILSGITPNCNRQISLFEPATSAQQLQLSQTIDQLNNRFGRNTVKIASQGTSHGIPMSQENVSKQFTTNWNDIISIKC